MADTPTRARPRAARPVSEFPIPATDITQTLTRVEDLARQARNLAQCGRGEEIKTELAARCGLPERSAIARRTATIERRAAVARLTELAHELRRVMLWAAYDWHPNNRSPYESVMDDSGDYLWALIITDDQDVEVMADAEVSQ